MINLKNNIKKCLIIGHLSLGDQLIINGLVRYISNKYSITYILCKNKNLKSLISMYEDDNSIVPISVNTDDYMINNDHYIFNLCQFYLFVKYFILKCQIFIEYLEPDF